MKTLPFSIFAAVLVTFSLWLVSPISIAYAQTEDDVIINEFVFNPSSGREYVELLVVKPGGVDMRGWTISDVDTLTSVTSLSEGDITINGSFLERVPQGTYVVIVFKVPTANTNILSEDISIDDGNNRLVILPTTEGVTTSGTLDLLLSDNLVLYATSRGSGINAIDLVKTGSSTVNFPGASWTSPNIIYTSNTTARFVPESNTLSGFRGNDTGTRFAVDAGSYGTPGFTNSGVASDTAVTLTPCGDETLTAGYYTGLEINAPCTMAGNTQVYNQLALYADLDTGTSTLLLGSQAVAAADGTGDVIGTVKRASFQPGASYSFGNPHVRITFDEQGTLPSEVTVTLSKSSGFSSSVQRKYTISQTGGAGYSAALRLRYLDTELNGNIESLLRLFWKESENWVMLEETGTTRSSTENWVEKNGVSAFSDWTLAAQSPTSITLSRLSAHSRPRFWPYLLPGLLLLFGLALSLRIRTNKRR